MKRKLTKRNTKKHPRKPRNNRYSPRKRNTNQGRRAKVRRLPARSLTRTELRAQARAFRALGLMRRENISLSKAARQERIKPQTLLRYAGRALFRSGAGKPWKARPEDKLSLLVTIPQSLGPQTVTAKNSAERRLAGAYLWALRMFRAGADGAEAELKTFEGSTVGGHQLITDLKLLIQLEEADLLEVDTLYTALGARL